MNWGALKAAVAAWANRNDIAAMMPTFLALAEQRIYQGMSDPDVDALRLSSMLRTQDPFLGTLPPDCERVHQIIVTRGGIRSTVEARPPADILPLTATTSGRPANYSIVGQAVVYGPALSAGDAAELLYYARFASPALDTDENPLMAASPGIYLYAMLCEVATYMRDDALLTMAVQLFAGAQRAAMENDTNRVMGGGPLRITSSMGMVV